MLLCSLRQEVVRLCRAMVDKGLTTGTGGNVSLIDREASLVAASPSGLDYAVMEPCDVAVVDPAGRHVEGEYPPTSELGFHLALYNARPDIGAVVHTHSVHATTLACLGWELPAVHYLVGFAGNKVPLAPYATFGSPELAENVVRGMQGFDAVLMANHGLVVVGRDGYAALAAAEELELVARIYLLAKSVGDPVILDDGEMERVRRKFESYGRKKG